MSAFLIRYYDDDTSSYIVYPVRPGPSDVEYPEAREFELQRPRDGGAVVQRPERDGRLRKWLWSGYRETVPLYATLWSTLKLLNVKFRLDAGYEDPRIQIWDGVTGTGGFGLTTDDEDPDIITYTNLKWTWVRVLRVDRKVRGKGGFPVWDPTLIEFVVDDEDYIDAED